METQRGEVTLLLRALAGGNKEAGDRLIPLVYEELKKIASRHMRLEKPGHTLQATALVHEAYLKLVDHDVDWKDRAHFFGVAAQVMRRILVDYARQSHAQKRGGPAQKQITLEEGLAYARDNPTDVITVDLVLTKLGEFDPRQCRIVELRYFAGLTIEETAEIMKLSSRTVKREWSVAKAWLYGELAKLRVNPS